MGRDYTRQRAEVKPQNAIKQEGMQIVTFLLAGSEKGNGVAFIVSDRQRRKFGGILAGYEAVAAARKMGQMTCYEPARKLLWPRREHAVFAARVLAK